MNNVSIVGRLTRDPEIRHTPSGTAVAELRIAVDRAGERDSDGNYGAGFFNASAWDRQAELCGEYLGKGRLVGISGELKFREWEAKDGSGRRSAVEIRAFRVDFLDRADDNGDGGGGSRRQAGPAGGTGDFAGAGADDDIPF